jgi:hypothetical protein
MVLGHIPKDMTFLPDTKNAIELCRKNYPFRSLYPFETWLAVDGGTAEGPAVAPRFSVPLDLVPELLINYHIIPILKRQKKGRILESSFLRRRLKKDCLVTQEPFPQNGPGRLFDVLCAQINIWDKFYKKMKAVDSGERINFHRYGRFDHSWFSQRWNKTFSPSRDAAGLISLWVYPILHKDDCVNVSLNLKPDITPRECRRIIRITLEAFKYADYILFLGSEESMLGRINTLSGHALLDPWLFKYHGTCLFGDPRIKERTKEPKLQIVKEKYQDLLLTFFMLSTPFMCDNSYPYVFYKLCFTLDHLFKNNEIILDDRRLSEIYGAEFITEDKFDPKIHTSGFLSALKQKHGFDIFGD